MKTGKEKQLGKDKKLINHTKSLAGRPGVESY